MRARTIACLSGILMFGSLVGARAARVVTLDTSNITGSTGGTLVYDAGGTTTLAPTGSVTVVSGYQSGQYSYPSDTTSYAVIKSGNTATFTISGGTDYFGIAWGTVDSYNTITFSTADGKTTTFTGSQIANLLKKAGTTITLSSSDIYANFVSADSPITKAVLSTSSNSFEFDDVRIAATPLPAAISLFGLGLVGLGMTGWRKRRKPAN